MKTQAAVVEAQEENTVQGVPVIHDLFTRPIKPLRSWTEWLERWQAAISIDEMVGLLHRGFLIPIGAEWTQFGMRPAPNTTMDRLKFYLHIADGWARSMNFYNHAEAGIKFTYKTEKDDKNDQKSPSDLRQEAADKAYECLCQYVFKTFPLYDPNNHQEWLREWEREMTPEFIAVMMYFFRLEVDGDQYKIRNIDVRFPDRYRKRSHNEEHAINFLLNFSSYLWKWKEQGIESYWKDEEKNEITQKNTLMRALIDSAKPWMIEVLEYLNKIRLLEYVIYDLNEECLAKLHEIAMREKFEGGWNSPVRKARKVESLDEARFLYSHAAELLHRREFMIAEKARLQKIREIEEEQEKREKELEKLKAKK